MPFDQYPGPAQYDGQGTQAPCGFHRKYPIPAGVGVDWGDYARFTQWQEFGRHVTKDIVDPYIKQWEEDHRITLVEQDTGVTEVIDDEQCIVSMPGPSKAKPLRERLESRGTTDNDPADVA